MMKIAMIVEKKLKNLKKNKNTIYVFFILFFCFEFCLSQTTIKGYINDEFKEVIPFVSIIVKKDSLLPIINYTYSNKKGMYSIKIIKEGSYYLSFSCLGFKSKTIKVNVKESDINLIKNITLTEKSFYLNEIIVSSNKPIKIKKDTIVFNAKHFLTGDEQVVEDLLKKIPGITVDNNGTIKVGNKEIEKLMVDGDDFFEKGYKILSKNMPSQPIDKVELLNNYSTNRLLKNIENSDKVALNLKLKENFKRIWFGNINANYGIVSENIYETRFNLANFGKKNKYFFIGNFNNIGFDAIGDIEQLIRPFRNSDEPASIGDSQKVGSLLNLTQSNLDFKKNRTNFNNAELISVNAIFNPTKKLKIKTLGFFNLDETKFFRNSTEIVNSNSADFINSEDYQLGSKSKIAFGKIETIYNFSKFKMLKTITKYKEGNFSNNSNLVFNGNATVENLQNQNTFFDQKISYTNKFDDKKVLLLTGRYINEKSPQNYKVNQFFFQNLFPTFSSVNNIVQQSSSQMQFIGVNAHLLNRRNNGDLLELQFGNELRKDKLSSIFSLLEDDTILSTPDGYQNYTKYNINDLYFKTKYQLKIKDFDIIGKLNLHQFFNQLDNNSIKVNENPIFINPSIGFEWKLNEKNKINASYSYNIKNSNVLEVVQNYTLTGFRSFSKGISDFNHLNTSSVFLNYKLGNWSDRFFANTFVLYSKNYNFYSTNTTLNQNFTQTQKILIENREFLNINSKLDYYFKFLSSNLKLNFGYSQSEFKNSVNNSNLKTITSFNYNYGLELRSGFKGILNYHIGSKWNKTEIETTTNNSFTNNISFLDLSFVFNDEFDVKIESEIYYFGNLETDNTYYFLDFDVRYKVIKNKFTLGITGKNLFNTEKFRNFSISDIGASTTEYRLLPRFVLLKMEYRF